jgi:hypothetical protein
LTRRLGGELSGLSSVGSIPLGRNGTLDGTLNSGVSSDESGGLFGVVGLDLIRVSVEEQVGEDGPSLSVDGSSETEDLSAEEVPDLQRVVAEALISHVFGVSEPYVGTLTRPIECRDLLLQGIATSTNFNEASTSQRAITLFGRRKENHQKSALVAPPFDSAVSIASGVLLFPS